MKKRVEGEKRVRGDRKRGRLRERETEGEKRIREAKQEMEQGLS